MLQGWYIWVSLRFPARSETIALPWSVAMADTVRICKLYENNHQSDEVGLDKRGPECSPPGNGP